MFSEDSEDQLYPWKSGKLCYFYFSIQIKAENIIRFLLKSFQNCNSWFCWIASKSFESKSWKNIDWFEFKYWNLFQWICFEWFPVKRLPCQVVEILWWFRFDRVKSRCTLWLEVSRCWRHSRMCRQVSEFSSVSELSKIYHLFAK